MPRQLGSGHVTHCVHQRFDVSSRTSGVPKLLLPCTESRRANAPVHPGWFLVGVVDARQSVVNHFDLENILSTRNFHGDVFRLDVSMNKPGFVEGPKAREEVSSNLEQLVPRKRVLPPIRQNLVQVFAGVLHN